MPTIRWGLLSTAHINRMLIPAIRASKNGTLAAVASRDMEKGRAYAAEWQIPRVFGSYEEMLASDAVDVVYISLPNHLHAEWTIKAMQAGKHVLCEKPFAISVEQVDAMITAQKTTGRVLQEAFMYRHHPQTKLVGEMVRAGKLGEIKLVRGMFSFWMSNREGNVRLVPGYGGGALWDVGCYPLSFAQFVYGKLPASVTGQQWAGPTDVDESFAGQMAYTGGAAAQIEGAFCVPYYTFADIHGTEGRITLNRPFQSMNERDRKILFTSSKGKEEQLRVKSIDPYLGEVENMNAAIGEGAPTLITLEESRMHVQTEVALYGAARSGMTVGI